MAKPSKIILRSGFKSQAKSLKAAEPAYLTDSKELAIGDDTSSPGIIPTTKSRGSYDFSSTDTFTFNKVQITGTLNGKDIAEIIDKVDSAYSADTKVFYTQLPSGSNIVVRSASVIDPPTNPARGSVYLVPSNASGAWAGKDGYLAEKNGTSWIFTQASVLTVIGVADSGATLRRSSRGWVNYFPTAAEQKDRTIDDRPATPAGVYAIIESYTGGDGDTPLGGRYTVSDDAPGDADLRDQWWNSLNDTLYTWTTDGEAFNWVAISGDNGTASEAQSSTDYTLPLAWRYGSEKFSFETFDDDERFTWRDFSATPITGGDAGDDSLDVENTEGLKIGNTYAIYNAFGNFVQSVDIISVLNSNRVRLRNDLSKNYTAASRVFLSRTSFDVRRRYALVKDNDRFFTRFLTNIGENTKSHLVIRRSAGGSGVFTVNYKIRGDSVWSPLNLRDVIPEGTEYRDEYYTIPRGGNIQFDIGYQSTDDETETVFHFATFPRAQTVDANRVYPPVNQAPSNQQVNVSVNPTLIGSPYRSLYGLPQNGAEFQVAVDEKFTNLVISSSTDFLAAWEAVPIDSGNARGSVFITNQIAVTVTDSGRIRISRDAGNTYTAGTPSSPFGMRGVAYSGSRLYICGVSGTIHYSDNYGVSTTSAASVGGGYTGTFNGITANGSISVAVGALGEIQRSINGGVIYAKVAADNAYAGTFNAIEADPTGNFMIAVGSNGEIQTSSNKGASFIKRSNSNNYTGNFYGVTMDGEGNAIVVGASGEIQRSSDYGATWTHVDAANSYVGAFYDVDLFNGNALAVGSGGEIHSSKDYGRTWSHRIPANAETGTFRCCSITADNYAVIAGDSGIIQKAVKLSASTSYTVPAGSDFLSVNSVYYWRVRYQDNGGFWSDYSEPTIFATQTTLNGIKQAQNISPAVKANVSTTPRLQSSTFKTTSGADTHNSSQWQVATDPAFKNLVVNTGDDTVNKLTYTIPLASALNPNVTYYWRVRHKGVLYSYGPWSSATTFTAISKPNTPSVVFPLDSTYVTIEGLIVKTSTFSSNIPGDALQTVEVQFSRNADFINAHTKKGTSKDVVISDYDLLYNNTYYLRVRHKGTITNDFSSWSRIVSFISNSKDSVGEAAFQTTKEWIVPKNVNTVSVVCIGGGSAPRLVTKNGNTSMIGGAGGGLTWKNKIPVTPGQKIMITVGEGGTAANTQGGTSSFGSIMSATGGTTTDNGGVGGKGGIALGGDGGGFGGNSFPVTNPNAILKHSGGGGAAGYNGNGGDGAYYRGATTANNPATAGDGGGGGGGALSPPSAVGTTAYRGYRGGGVGVRGNPRHDGDAGSFENGSPLGGNGSGGADNNTATENNGDYTYNGGRYGGGGAGGFITPGVTNAVVGGKGCVRVMWNASKSFPDNAR